MSVIVTWRDEALSLGVAFSEHPEGGRWVILSHLKFTHEHQLRKRNCSLVTTALWASPRWSTGGDILMEVDLIS